MLSSGHHSRNADEFINEPSTKTQHLMRISRRGPAHIPWYLDMVEGYFIPCHSLSLFFPISKLGNRENFGISGKGHTEQPVGNLSTDSGKDKLVLKKENSKYSRKISDHFSHGVT